MDEKETENLYFIPANYTDSGKLLGGMIDTRNAVETLILLGAVGYPELFLTHAGDDPDCGDGRHPAAAGSRGGDGCGRGFPVSIPWLYHPVLDIPPETAFQEAWDSR